MGGHGNHLHTWPLLTAEQVQVNTPTQKDGWKASQEIAVRKKAGKVIYDTTKYFAHPMSSGTASVGVTLFLRFYSQNSMVKYHPFVMAVASLFLAGKINDEPRSLHSLMFEMLKQWYQRENPQLRQRLVEQDKMKNLWNTCVHGESILLNTVKFDLNVDILVRVVSQHVRKIPALHQLKKNEQAYTNVCNDIMRHDGTMVLQYSSDVIALSICHFILKRLKDVEMPPESADGKPWYEEHGLSAELYEVLCERIMTMYRKMKRKSPTSTNGKRSIDAGKSSKVAMSSVAHKPIAPEPRIESPTKKQKSMDVGDVDSQPQFPFSQNDAMPPGTHHQQGEDSDSPEEGEIR
jgi:hypothetical protein